MTSWYRFCIVPGPQRGPRKPSADELGELEWASTDDGESENDVGTEI